MDRDRRDTSAQRPDARLALMTSATLQNAARLLDDGATDAHADMAWTLRNDAAAIEQIERALSEGRDTDALALVRELQPWGDIPARSGR